MAFYKCSKCERIWQQPVKICPYCFIDVEKMKSKGAKVIGVSKVDIPTLFHPQTPYFLLVLEDSNGNKWVHKSVKELKIGDELKFKSDKDAIAVWRIKYDIPEAIEKTEELLGGLNLNENSKVLVLPTLVSPNHTYSRDNTSQDFLKAVLDLLFEKGIKPENMKIGTQSFDEIPIEASAQKSGLLDVCLKRNIVPLDLSKTNFVKQGNLEISEEVTKADLVLNLAILKMDKASATENMFRVLKKENYSGLKYLSSDKDIAEELGKSISNVLTLGEAEFVKRGNKLAAYMGLIISGKNAMHIDRVFNEIATVNTIPEILKDINIEDIKVVGREIREVKYNAETF